MTVFFDFILTPTGTHRGFVLLQISTSINVFGNPCFIDSAK